MPDEHSHRIHNHNRNHIRQAFKFIHLVELNVGRVITSAKRLFGSFHFVFCAFACMCVCVCLCILIKTRTRGGAW